VCTLQPACTKFYLLFVSNDVIINTLEPAKFSSQGDRERSRGEEREMPPCEARVLAENASVADIYYEYSSGGLDRTTALSYWSHNRPCAVIAKIKIKYLSACLIWTFKWMRN